MPAARKNGADTALATNRKARHEYEILESWEPGISLTGGEVKSCREGHASLQEAWAAFEEGELWVYGMHVQPYTAAISGFSPPLPDRPKKLLMHRRELTRLSSLVQLKGHTLVPLKLYLARGRIKLQLGLGKGKLLYDKRESLKRKQDARDAARERRGEG